MYFGGWSSVAMKIFWFPTAKENWMISLLRLGNYCCFTEVTSSPSSMKCSTSVLQKKTQQRSFHFLLAILKFHSKKLISTNLESRTDFNFLLSDQLRKPQTKEISSKMYIRKYDRIPCKNWIPTKNSIEILKQKDSPRSKNKRIYKLDLICWGIIFLFFKRMKFENWKNCWRGEKRKKII